MAIFLVSCEINRIENFDFDPLFSALNKIDGECKKLFGFTWIITSDTLAIGDICEIFRKLPIFDEEAGDSAVIAQIECNQTKPFIILGPASSVMEGGL